MLHLHTFGTLELRKSGGTGLDVLLAQPRSTALLIYLLLARPHGFVTRDILCALFWPDADEEHARGALSQTLSRIRRAAGPGIVQLRGRNELRIAPERVGCDVLAFEAALEADDHAAALEQYRGPFLNGFHAPGMSGFERWAELERDRLRALAAGAARALALEHAKAGRLEEAESAAARALALAPERETVALELAGALAEAGDRPGALRLLESWSENLARDLELEVSVEIEDLVRELRVADESSAPRGAVDAALLPAATSAPADGGPAPPPRAPRSAPWGLRRGMAAVSAAGTALLVGTWVLVQLGLLGAGFPVTASGRAAGGLAPQDWLLVADFESSSTDPALALAFQTLLVRDLESAGYSSVVGGLGAMSRRGLEGVLARMRLPPEARIDPDLACDMAEREGAAGVLAGRVLPLGDEYVVVASVLETPGCGELIRASASASFEELSAAVTAVSRELRARLGESRASIRGSPPLPPITAGYIQALRAVSRYISTPAMWDDPRQGAAPLLEAIRVEPDLAFAHFLLALHFQRLGDYERAVPHILRAHELRAQLPRPGRLGMDAIHQRYIASNPRAAMATVQGLVAGYPALADATMPFLADAALWIGDWQRALDVSLVYLQRKPAGLGAHLGYSRAAAAAWALGRTALADSLYDADALARRSAGLAPDRAEALLRLLRLRDWRAADALCADQPDWDRCAWVHLARGRLEAATHGLAAVHDDTASRHPWRRAAATAALAHIEVQRGRPERAWSVLESAGHAMPMTGLARAGTHLRRFLLCATAADIGRSPDLAGCTIESENPATWDADPSFTVLLRSGAWSRRLLAARSLERGDAARALSQARDAVRSNFDNPGALDHLLLARAFDALANADSALAHYIAATRTERDCCFPTAAAIALPLAPVYRRIGELAETRGDVKTAQHYYGAFLALWEQADPVLQPQVANVRARVERLGLP